MAFWSIVLPGKGKEVEQEVESSETVLSSIHVTGLALGAAPGKAPHVIAIEYNGTNTVLATLEAPHTRQFRLDIALDQTFKITNHGDTPVYAYGYQVATSNHIEDMSADEEDEDEDEDEDFDEGEDEEEDDDDEEDDDEQPPTAVPLANGGKGKRLRQQRRDADDDEEDDDEEEGDGIPDFKDLNPDDLVAENQGEDEDEDEEGDDDADEEDEVEEDEEMEEQDTPPRVPAKVGSKRPPPAQTPQPAKAQRGAMRAEPKSAPPKQQAGPRQIPVTTPAAQKGDKEAKGAIKTSNEAEFLQALVSVVKNQKLPVPLAVLGSAVVRPEDMKGRDFKLGAYLEQHAELFAVDPKKGVSLKKGGGKK
ncbi:hypothetical protein HXX76_010138 [Chlamydomonas incerta]|uniref:Nucleoplasmin-like domain-containing protein n=1 Tax=Chlamydomonas incerta TaxID=51695 RepID=A0A835T1B0_CHLIN|nr:hypothetical protein HXX76_010138 [Chlamydomonas incerta]|eukprot:KAG2430620.1 hypothetical protein HXX76_010138 [Chlamydomonas incerta]